MTYTPKPHASDATFSLPLSPPPHGGPRSEPAVSPVLPAPTGAEEQRAGQPRS